MKIRCEFHLGDKARKVFLVPKPEEKADHLVLKLAALAMFHAQNPVVDLSADHPSLSAFAHRPDVCVFNEGGEISHWIECGTVSLHKVDKVLRRMSSGRFIVIKPDIRGAQKFRNDLNHEVRNGNRVEIWAWENEEFLGLLKVIGEKTELFGEAHERFLNVVVNEHPYVAQLVEV